MRLLAKIQQNACWLPPLPGSSKIQGVFFPSKISGVGTNFGLLVHVLQGPNKQRAYNPSLSLSCIRRQTISPAASFVLDIHFTKSYFCDSRCPFGQIGNRKQMLKRLRSHFQTNFLRLDSKKAPRQFYFCEFDLMGHRWPKVMVI